MGSSIPEKCRRIVIVEDQTIFRELLADALEGTGRFQVVAQLSTGGEALPRCREARPDLIILDAVLPDSTGLDVLRELMAYSKRFRVLMISAHSRPALVQEAVELGARGFVAKDTPLSELTLAVERVLVGGRYFCSVTSCLLAEALANPTQDESLTPRQREIVRRVASGQSSRRIAEELGLSEKTVQNHRLQIRQRLNLHDVASLTRYAIEQGLVEPKA